LVIVHTDFRPGLCARRGWKAPEYTPDGDGFTGYTSLVNVNGRIYLTDTKYSSAILAKENAAMRAFMVCQNYSGNGGMLASNGLVQGVAVVGSSLLKGGEVDSSRVGWTKKSGIAYARGSQSWAVRRYPPRL
jgi:hypothetical protein